nr:hypothetical protein [Lachnospiraceae bacterium]
MNIPKDLRKNALLISAIVTYGVYLVFGIYGEKYLYADGANYFYEVISAQDFHIYPLGRSHYDYMFQFLTVFAARLGVTSIKVLGGLMAFSLSFYPAFFYFAAILVCIRHKKYLFGELIYVISFFSLTFVGFAQIIESVAAL